jgi:transcriptional regulator with XRE-family HTH domain
LIDSAKFEPQWRGDMVANVTPAQCIAARMLLKWSTRELARQTGTAASTIQKFENGGRNTHQFVVDRIRQTLVTAGIEFIPSETAHDAAAQARAIELSDGSGVRLVDE